MNDAVSARIVEILNDEPYCRIGRVELSGVLRKINLSFVPEARAGERVLVRGGVAVRVLGAEECEASEDSRATPEPV